MNRLRRALSATRKVPGLTLAMAVPPAALLIVVMALAAGSGSGQPITAYAHPAAPPAPVQCAAPPVTPALPFVGDAPGAPWQADVAQFTRAAGGRPTVIENYTRFGTPFDAARACEVTRDGALPLVQMNPTGTSMAAIAAGRYDRYLASYARAVRAYRDPLVLSFAHEMNGKWFSWGYTHTSPATFIAAWRHVHDVFTRAGARNVIWLWNVNRDIHRSQPTVVSPPADWWPGSRYVTWVGIDAYFNNPSDTFRSVFAVTLTALRHFTHDPVLITETAVGPGPEQARQIGSLFAGVRHTPGVLGFVWFDQDRRQKWHLEDRPPAAAAFRRALS
ncbi:MAG: Beta-mannanase-like protein [Streptosporangiaceae bacterium]|nr:Beta-mannanase-like protein [Streptosporangiaceae bacterium]